MAVALIKRTWQTSGTRWIGYITTALGLIGLVDATTIQALATLAGPVWGPKVPLIFLVLTGIGTALRGHKNAADIAAATVSQASTGQVVASAEVVTAAAKTAVAADDKISPPPPEKP